MISNRSMPPGVIIPELPYDDVETAAEWLCNVFGFQKRLQIANHRFQLLFQGASIVAIQSRESGRCSTLVNVEAVDAHYQHAAAAGAEIVNPPANYPFGERQYTARDVGGHLWTFSESIADSDPTTWGGVLFE